MKNKFTKKISGALILTLALAGSVGMMTGCKSTELVDEMTAAGMSSASFNACLDIDVPITAKDPSQSTAITIKGNWNGTVTGLDTSSYNGSNGVAQSEAGAVEASANASEDEELEGEELEFEDDEYLEYDFSEPLDIEISGNSAAAIDGSMTYTFATEEPEVTDYKYYYETIEDEDAVLYTFDEDSDEWYYESVVDGDISYYISGYCYEKAKEDTKAVWYKADKKSGKKDINGRACSVLELKASPEDSVTLLKTYSEAFSQWMEWEDYSTDLETTFGCDINEVFEIIPLTFRAYVDNETKVLMGIEIECTKFDKDKYMKLNEMTKEDFDDIFGFEISKVDISNAKLTLTFSNINSATVEIPEEVHQVYEDSFLDMEDFDFEDIEWEETEENDETEEIAVETKPAKKDTGKKETDVSENTPEVSADDIEDEEDDEEWEDEEEEVDEDRSDATTVDLCDSEGNKIATLSVPLSSGLAYYPDYSEPDCLDFMDKDWEIDCNISSTIDTGFANYELEDYLLYSDDEDYDPEVTYTKEAISIGQLGGTAYYVEGKGGEDGDEYYIVVPFNDPDGEPNYITISFMDNRVEGWTKEDYIKVATEVFQ